MTPSPPELSAIVACEIEFYLYASVDRDLTPFWEKVRTQCTAQGIGIFRIEKERGHAQYEVALMPTSATESATHCKNLKAIITKTADAYSVRTDFSAKPQPDQPGSGLHVHVHLENSDGKNVFYKDDKSISDPLKYSIGGLLHWLPQQMPIFAPSKDSYARFAAPDHHTPTTISWGANNRTCAVRLPDSEKHLKRIEHRVAGADANPAATVEAIVAAMHWGIANKAEPPPQCYGDANLAKHQLPKLPLTLQEAMALAQLKDC